MLGTSGIIDRPPLKFSWMREAHTGATLLTLRIEDCLPSADLDAFDYGLIKECEKSDAIADKLLALECIVRKIEQGLGVKQP